MVRLGLIFLLSWIVCVHSIHTLINTKANIIKPKKEIQIFQNSARNGNQIEITRSQHLERRPHIRSHVGIIDRPNIRAGSRTVLRRESERFSSALEYSQSRPQERNISRRPFRSQRRGRTKPSPSPLEYRRQPSINLSRPRDRNRYLSGLGQNENYDTGNRYPTYDRLPTDRRFDIESGRNVIYRIDTNNELPLDSRANSNHETRNNQMIERNTAIYRPSAYRVENDPLNDLVKILDTDLRAGSLSQRPSPRGNIPVNAKSQTKREQITAISGERVRRIIPIPIPRRIPLSNHGHPAKPTTNLARKVNLIRPLKLEPATDPLKTVQSIPKPSDIVPKLTSSPTRQTVEQRHSPLRPGHTNALKKEKGAMDSFAMLSQDPAIQAALKVLAPLLTRAEAHPMRPTEIIKTISPKAKATEKPLILRESMEAPNLKPPERKTKVIKGDPELKVTPSKGIIQQTESDSIVLKQGITKTLESFTNDRPSIETPLLQRPGTSKAPVINILSDSRMEKSKPITPSLDLSQLKARSRQRSMFYGEEMEEIPGFGQGLRNTNGMFGLSRLLSFYSSNKEAEENPLPRSFPNSTSFHDMARYFRSIGIEEMGPEIFNRGKGGYPESSRLMGYVSREGNEKMMGESEMPEMFSNMYINSNVNQNKELENVQNTDTYKTSQHTRFIQMGEEFVPVPVDIGLKTSDSAKEIYKTARNKLKPASGGTKLDSLLLAQSSVPKANSGEKVDIRPKRDKKGANLKEANLKNIPTSEIIKMLIRELAKMIV